MTKREDIRALARKQWERRRIRTAVLAAAGALAALAVWWWGEVVLHAAVPMTREDWHEVDEAVRLQTESQFRLAVVQAAVAVGGVVALLYTARNYRLSRRGQVTDRFTKALERLGSEEMYVRLGGVLALEQIVVDSPDQATHAAQVLNAFIRDRAPRAQPDFDVRETGQEGAAALRVALNWRGAFVKGVKLSADVQAALTALTRPEAHHHTHELQRLDLTDAKLEGADLTDAWLYQADLTGAKLNGANLTGANLGDAVLADAWLVKANLTDAKLDRAQLADAKLVEADLTNAWLHEANMVRTRLSGADLRTASALTVAQVLTAYLETSTKLRPWIASDPAVVARVAERAPVGSEWPPQRPKRKGLRLKRPPA
ncbi:pentapeptide repeat-containing protein [Streptomyces sp. IB2014 016-6]|uniref:pentapeptide repeat-containing protein n=1 Tax=Streptomyces sp. IB2014 016-6 TaxID=2517818 RepID=UPI0011CBA5FF|nr:pentapeptide repeat-containing protein [Streptomyces sp. IB2014 016-6]TXL84513.1 pentapeptide repeat-containing protein [Streptomyces sp. IB2014 016-6]